MSMIGSDLDATITAAVNARVEAAVTEALAGDEVIGRYVTAALQQPVEVKMPGEYGRGKAQPWLHHVLTETIRGVAQEAVKRLIADELPAIEDECRKALRRQIAPIAETLAGSLEKAAASAYGVKVDLTLTTPSGG